MLANPKLSALYDIPKELIKGVETSHQQKPNNNNKKKQTKNNEKSCFEMCENNWHFLESDVKNFGPE